MTLNFFYYQFSNIDWYAESYDGKFFSTIMLLNASYSILKFFGKMS